MKNLVCQIACRLSLLTAFLLAVSCQKELSSPNGSSDEVYTVKFKIQDFSNFTQPINNKSSASVRKIGSPIAATEAGVDAGIYHGQLYFWSFNDESTKPDIALAPGSEILFDDDQVIDTYAVGWSFNDYVAGSSVSLRGLDSLKINMPIQKAISLESFRLDIGSSGTGPKAFDVYYAVDGAGWMILAENNQFINASTNYSKSSFEFDLGSIGVTNSDVLSFKIIPKAGERGNSSDYNASAGVTRVDNIALVGTSEPSFSEALDVLQYFVFDATSNKLVKSEIHPLGAEDDVLSVELPRGNYNIAMVSNKSNQSLIYPEGLTLSDNFQYSNLFSNYGAVIFGHERNIFVDTDIDQEISMDRYFSQIKFEFSDTGDLSSVKKIIITPMHDPVYYSPFNPGAENNLVDQSDIEIKPDFSLSKQLVFNQFLGRLNAPKDVQYRLSILGESDKLLRTFEVGAAIKNNVQVVFKGELLQGYNYGQSFQLHFNEEWDEGVEVTF